MRVNNKVNNTFITVCNKVDDVNLAKQKRAPTMTAPVPATYVVQG